MFVLFSTFVRPNRFTPQQAVLQQSIALSETGINSPAVYDVCYRTPTVGRFFMLDVSTAVGTTIVPCQKGRRWNISPRAFRRRAFFQQRRIYKK